MKYLVALILLSSTVLAGYCPNLAGTYAVCSNSDNAWTGTKNLEIKQTDENGQIRYVITSDGGPFSLQDYDVIADGESHVIRSDDTLTGTQTVSCYEGKLVVELAVDNHSPGVEDFIRRTELMKMGNKIFFIDDKEEPVNCSSN
ncbi:MAG: hypothetical protein BM556_01765 [Bacteriovorax sp. MedPE-SWde]|nr:MAG: hypothetical protein BM556_01765 [Bacteriovorax sp. MedPE-SWde]